MLIPKRKSMVEGLENVIVSLYAKGMSAKENGILIDEVIDDQLVEKSIYKKENIKKGEVIENCGGSPVSLNFFKFNSLDEAKLLLVLIKSILIVLKKD